MGGRLSNVKRLGPPQSNSASDRRNPDLLLGNTQTSQETVTGVTSQVLKIKPAGTSVAGFSSDGHVLRATRKVWVRPFEQHWVFMFASPWTGLRTELRTTRVCFPLAFMVVMAKVKVLL